MEFKPRKFRIQAYDSFTRSQSISTNRRVSSIHCVEKYAKLCSLPDFDNFSDFLRMNWSQKSESSRRLLWENFETLWCPSGSYRQRWSSSASFSAGEMGHVVLPHVAAASRYFSSTNQPAKTRIAKQRKKTWRTSYHKEILQHFQHEKIGKLPRKPLSAICHVMSRL